MITSALQIFIRFISPDTIYNSLRMVGKIDHSYGTYRLLGRSYIARIYRKAGEPIYKVSVNEYGVSNEIGLYEGDSPRRAIANCIKDQMRKGTI